MWHICVPVYVISVCVCVHIGVDVLACICMCEGQMCMSKVFLYYSLLVFFFRLWGWLPWLDMKLMISAKLTDQKFQRFIYLYAPSIGIIYKHWNIWLFCLRWVYKLKNSCLHSMYFNPYSNFPSSLCDDLFPTLILILIQRCFLNHTMYLYACFHCSLNINSTHPATLHYKPL